MPTCSRLTSTTHSAKKKGDDPRIVWRGVIRVVRNYSKRTLFSMSSFFDSRNCVLHLRTLLDWQRIQKKVYQNKTWCNHFPELRDTEKDLLMVLDMARPKNKQSSIWPGMRGRDAARKSTLKVNILQVFTIGFSGIQFIVNHNSQSDGQNQSAKSGMNLLKKTIHVVSLQRKRKDTKDNGILLWTKQAKMGQWNFDLIFEPLSDEKSPPPRIKRTSWRAYPSRSIQTMASLFKHIVEWDKVWMELEMSSIFLIDHIFFLVQLVSFTVDSDPL